MLEILRALPEDYREFSKPLDADLELSERLVEACVRVRRRDHTFVAELWGRRAHHGTVQLLPAISLTHNWVSDGQVVRPLPFDTPSVVAALLNGMSPHDLAFSGVIALLRLPESQFIVLADDDVLLPARQAVDQIAKVGEIHGLNARLYPYQARGVQWMLETVRHTGGLILADEMGLGKTIQIISLFLSERPTSSAPALIICPTTLIANWRREILRFAPDLSLMIHRGANRTGVSRGLQRAQVVITSYDTLVSDAAIFSDVKWSWLICDEAQALKNLKTARRIAVSTLSSERTIPVTGTPVETSLVDLWSIADLAIPGLLGTRAEFEKKYQNDESCARALATLTDPIVLKRRVADVALELPDRIDIDLPLELTASLAEEYNRVLEATLEEFRIAGPLVATGRLQLFCAHPWLVGADTAREVDWDDARLRDAPAGPLLTPKLERTIEILREAFSTRKKVLIFAIFNRCGELIRRAGFELPPAFWGAINGSTPQEDRQRIVDEFTAHDGPGCLILNPKAAGAGLNITAASIVIHYTQSWNPAIEAQASARAHRLGQSQPVYIYRLFYEDTVERVMMDRSAWRRELGNEAVPVSVRDAADLKKAIAVYPRGQDV